ncbi:hypothetical protein [Bremerella sp. P1]|uniref:hypothetical protein n=1 Tax=Bremerella sp. P1 TaxID=3026424 RepID=UPI002367522E|nr:hypothetical protein [Bremerella sp. P1]WDI42576.1 hypothetical protein PSR63_01280 [Bremerella sp. P1]
MKTILSRMFATLVLLSTTSLATADEQRPTPQAEMVALKIRVLEAMPENASKTLAEPTIMTLTCREIRFVSGGEMKSKFDDTKHELGTQITATIEPDKSDTYTVKLSVTLGNLKLPDGEPETELFTQQKLTARTIVLAGKTKKIPVSPSRWCEITIEKPTANLASTPDSETKNR